MPNGNPTESNLSSIGRASAPVTAARSSKAHRPTENVPHEDFQSLMRERANKDAEIARADEASETETPSKAQGSQVHGSEAADNNRVVVNEPSEEQGLDGEAVSFTPPNALASTLSQQETETEPNSGADLLPSNLSTQEAHSLSSQELAEGGVIRLQTEAASSAIAVTESNGQLPALIGRPHTQVLNNDQAAIVGAVIADQLPQAEAEAATLATEVPAQSDPAPESVQLRTASTPLAEASEQASSPPNSDLSLQSAATRLEDGDDIRASATAEENDGRMTAVTEEALLETDAASSLETSLGDSTESGFDHNSSDSTTSQNRTEHATASAESLADTFETLITDRAETAEQIATGDSARANSDVGLIDSKARLGTYTNGFTVSATSSILAKQAVQATAELVSARSNGVDSVTIELHPAELGQLRIQVERRPDGITAHIFASEALSSELLNAQKQELQQDLADLGYENAHVDVTHDHQDGNKRRQSNSQSNPISPSATDTDASAKEAERTLLSGLSIIA